MVFQFPLYHSYNNHCLLNDTMEIPLLCITIHTDTFAKNKQQWKKNTGMMKSMKE